MESDIKFDWSRKEKYFFFYPPIATLKDITEEEIWKKKEISLYFHIPFCLGKCAYCYYVSLPKQKSENLISDYIDAMIQELKIYASLLDIENLIIKSIYFGGGTPTVLDSFYISKILNFVRSKFNIKKNAEITVDSCPGSLNYKKLLELREMGIKRICMGVQTFDDTILNAMGRTHNGIKAIESLNMIKEAGIDNRIIDLMYGLPGQNLNKIGKDLKTVNELKPEGLSYYLLSVRPGTFIYDKKSNFQFNPEKKNIKTNEFIIDFLNSIGYTQVATPSFTLFNHDFIHQRNYWSGGSYLGIGVSSFSFYNDYAFINTRSINEYINSLLKYKRIPLQSGRKVPLKEKIHREMSLRIKLLELDSNQFLKDYEIDITKDFCNEINFLINNDLIYESNGKFILTKDGIIHNNAISRLFYSEKIQNEINYLDKEKNIENNLV